jgi:hypothetical protein
MFTEEVDHAAWVALSLPPEKDRLELADLLVLGL